MAFTYTYDAEAKFQGVSAETLRECYIGKVKIRKVVAFNSKNSLSEAIDFYLETDRGNAKIRFFVLDSKGEEMKWNTKHLSQLNNITGINTSIFGKTIERPTDNAQDMELAYPNMEKIEVGAIIEYNGEKEHEYNGEIKHYPDYSFKAFYNLKTNKTTDEESNGQPAKNYERFKREFEQKNSRANLDSTPKNNNSVVEEAEEKEEDFPF